MIEEKSFEVYLNILCQTLQKKNNLLDQILALDKKQETLAKTDLMSVDEFEQLLNEKTPLLEELDHLDNGFELSYNRVKDCFSVYKDKHENVIRSMQKTIIEISERVLEIQRLELKNKETMRLKFSSMRQKIKDYNINNKSVSNYYKNMSNAYTGEATFMDKKK